MKKTSFFMFILALIWLLVACGEKAPSARVETIDGITQIYNLDVPLHPEKSVTFEEELAIDEEDAENKIYEDGDKYFIEKIEESKEVSVIEAGD